MFGSEEVSLPRVWSILMGRASVPFICFHLFLIPSGHLPSSPSSFSSLSPLLSTSDYLIVRPSLRSCSPLIYFSSLPSLRPSSSSFCLFINVLPVGVPWRQAAKSVTTATHCGLWRGGVANGCCILRSVEQIRRSNINFSRGTQQLPLCLSARFYFLNLTSSLVYLHMVIVPIVTQQHKFATAACRGCVLVLTLIT